MALVEIYVFVNLQVLERMHSQNPGSVKVRRWVVLQVFLKKTIYFDRDILV